MKNLITGGAGFIGSHLAESLLKRKEEVAIIDNLSTGSMENIEHLKGDPKFSFHIDTIMNESLMKRLVKECDVVYHMAAAVGVKYIIDNPLESLQTNVKGTEIVLEMANAMGKKKSSSLRLRKFTARTGPESASSRRMTTGCSALRRSRDGAIRAQRPWTNFSPWRTGARRSCRSSS